MPRVMAGALKGVALVAPPRVRLTESKVRQALFNIIGSRVVGAQVIDGFAGSGALGIEALSRGAARVLFLESHPACIRALRQNLLPVGERGIVGRWQLIPGDALRSLRALARRGQHADLILLDPPYGEGDAGRKALNVVADYGMLPPTGLVCLEHARQHEPPIQVGRLALIKQHRYGGTVLSFYQSGSGTLGSLIGPSVPDPSSGR